MARKNKNNAQKALDTINTSAMQAGIVLMTAATTLGLVEVPHDPDKRAIVPNQPVFAIANDISSKPIGGADIRREREETHQHAHTYGISQRTASRSGKI